MGAFGRLLDHKGWVFMNGISAMNGKGDPESSLAPSAM